MIQKLILRAGISQDDRPIVEFTVKIVGLYAIWKVFQLTVNHTPPLLDWWNTWVNVYAHNVATAANKFFVFMGYDVTFHYRQAVYIFGTSGFLVEEHCLAIPATLIFGAFIAVYRGPWKHKVWYIPLGMVMVQGINFARVVGLGLLMKHAPMKYFDFNHSFTALILEYGMVFLMIAIWMRKYADTPQTPSAAAY